MSSDCILEVGGWNEAVLYDRVAWAHRWLEDGALHSLPERRNYFTGNRFPHGRDFSKLHLYVFCVLTKSSLPAVFGAYPCTAMGAEAIMKTLLYTVNSLLQQHKYRAALAVVKGFRNGAV